MTKSFHVSFNIYHLPMAASCTDSFDSKTNGFCPTLKIENCELVSATPKGDA